MAGVYESARWEVLPPQRDAERALINKFWLHPLVARVLAARGWRADDATTCYLWPDLERDWNNPLTIPGLKQVADRVEAAIQAGQKIAVFGDFDVDGMTSSALLCRALRALGAKVRAYIPHRFDEGYGLSEAATERVLKDFAPDLVITVDNGIASKDEVARLVATGVDVVVTDHHEPGQSVPEGVPVADPKLDPHNPSKDLAGAGVALKLVQVLGERRGQPDLWRYFLDLAALGTVSDMMELTAENRALVTQGMAAMRASAWPGLWALAAESRTNLAQIEADMLPFSLVPRLNAAGRMGDVDLAFQLLMADDADTATYLAQSLERINDERRTIEQKLADEALEVAEATYHGQRCVVVGAEGWHEGVKGIVASRLVNKYHVPSLVFSIADGVARGSGRSGGSVNLYQAVQQCADLCVRFGGHAGAVGVTVEASKLDAFRERLEAVMAQEPPQNFEDKGEIAAVVELSELTLDAVSSLNALRPFGQGNKIPLLAAQGVTLKNKSLVGAGQDHMRFFISDGTASVPAIMFRVPNPERALAWEGIVDVVFEPAIETWQGRTKLKLTVVDILYRDASEESLADTQTSQFVQDLFDRAPEILSSNRFVSLAERDQFYTKAVGVTHDGRQEVLAALTVGEPLHLVREPENAYDKNAIALMTEAGIQVGYIRRELAAELAPLMDGGIGYTASVSAVTGGQDGQSLGVNIEVTRVAHTTETPAQERASLPVSQEMAALTDELRSLMIGEHSFLPAQAKSLELLSQGKSVLCVMATGRGKSLIFHVHAARIALLNKKASIFVYPLRALVNDQAFHLKEALAKVGVTVQTLTGETPTDQRKAIYEALSAGSCDVILTTPEYLSLHVGEFAASRRIGFVVIDEAHHAGSSKGGNRSAYQEMPRILQALGNPAVLATTATASNAASREICRLLAIDTVIKDASVRKNLSVHDAREALDRETVVTSLVASGQKCVIYVNSREQSVALARMLRQRIPELGHRISFYNAGLSRKERLRSEEAFRAGQLTCIVSTSAFGEGVNLPDIRHVVLYHLPFGAVEFNQMSGRAGRDGKPATVHVLFGRKDSFINERILRSQAPERPVLVALYRTLRQLDRDAKAAGAQAIELSNAQIGEAARTYNNGNLIDERTVSSGVSIFKELGFLTTRGFSTARTIWMEDQPTKMNLDASSRYSEGLQSQESFRAFFQWALNASQEELLQRIDRPLTPSFGEVVAD